MSSAFPQTVALLDSSLVLFSQSCPIFPQPTEIIDAYARSLRAGLAGAASAG